MLLPLEDSAGNGVSAAAPEAPVGVSTMFGAILCRSLGQALKFLIVQKMISLYACLFKHGIFGHFQNCDFAVQPIFFLS